MRCVINMPTHILSDLTNSMVKQIFNLIKSAKKLDSTAGMEQSPNFLNQLFMKSNKISRIVQATLALATLVFFIGSGRISPSGHFYQGTDREINAVMSAENMEAPGAPPSVFWVSDPVQPGEVVMVEGANWGTSPRIELNWLGDDKPGQPMVGDAAIQKTAVLIPLQVTASSVKFMVPADWKSGVYSFQVSVNDVTSAPELVNSPTPWWQQGDWGKEASPGGWLRVFGKCLSLNGKATVALQGVGQTLIFTPVQQDQWSLNVSLPGNMAAGEYHTWVHNGCGGKAGWKQVGIVKIRVHPPLWKSDVFDICEYGAVGNDEFEDGPAIQAALDAAGRNGGGIVFIPRGRFQVNSTLMIPRFVLMRGEGSDLSQLYWRDRITPLETLIQGTNSFGIEDLSILAVNHLAAIMTDPGTEPEAGNVFLRRLYIYLNRFENADFKMVTERLLERHFERPDQNLGAIVIGGENVQVTDCEIYSSQSPFRFNGHFALYSNNRCFQGGASHFISGTNVIFENNVVQGSQMAWGGGCYVRQNLYYAHNRIGDMAYADAELFTTDGQAEIVVNFVSIEGTKVLLDHNVDWKELTGQLWTGNATREVAFFITLGTGAGQYRFVKTFNEKKVEMNKPWDVLPDSTSTIILAPFYRNNMLIGNEFHDGSTVQSYCMGVDWVFASNKITRAGGIKNLGHQKLPSWYHQYIENEILVGSGRRGPWGTVPPLDSHLSTIGEGSRGTVFRRNVLHNNARIETEMFFDWGSWDRGIINDVIIDHNIIRDADVGINLRGRNNGILLWANHFERVKEPITGLNDGVFMHPAERLLNLLSAEGLVPEKLMGTTAWQTAIKHLESLLIQDPASIEVLNEVRIYQDELARTAANELHEGQSLSLLQALTGMTFMETSSAELQSLLSESTGGTANTSFKVSLPAWSIPITLSLSLPPLPGWKAVNPAPMKIKPGESVTTSIKLTVPSGVWGKPTIPLACKVKGTGWQLNGSGKIKLSALSSTDLVREWMVVGPFASDQPGLLGDTLYPPQRLLDITAEYPGAEGKVSWQPVKLPVGGGIDLTQLYGSQENGVAFAVTVLRVARPTTVAITTKGSYSITYLNNEIIGGPFRRYGNFKISLSLPEGDNVLLCGVAQTNYWWQGKFWQLSVQVEVGPGSNPGDIQIVPVEKINEVRALHKR
jgi:hypothetical protein